MVENLSKLSISSRDNFLSMSSFKFGVNEIHELFRAFEIILLSKIFYLIFVLFSIFFCFIEIPFISESLVLYVLLVHSLYFGSYVFVFDVKPTSFKFYFFFFITTFVFLRLKIYEIFEMVFHTAYTLIVP